MSFFSLLRLPLLTASIAVTLAASPTLQPLVSDSPADTGESSLVSSPDGTVYHTYAGPGGKSGERALWLETMAPHAGRWSTPAIIVSTPALMENWADFATLAIATDGALWAQWFQQKEGGGHGYDGWFARSTDAGQTWTTPAPLGHEFVSLAPLSGGRMLAVWLESTRAMHREENKARDIHAPAMRLMGRVLTTKGGTESESVIDPDVCTCCQTSLACLAGGRVLVTYRGHTYDETRDNRVAIFSDGRWSSPKTLHDDGWQIAACPVNGPAADAHDDHTAVAWFTAAKGIARVQARQSIDGGKTFAAPTPIDLGRPMGRIDLVMLRDGSSIVSWMEASTAEAEAGLYVRRLFADGSRSAPFLIAKQSAVRASGFARLAAGAGDDLSVVITWTEAVPDDVANPKSAATTRVRTARFAAGSLARDPSPVIAASNPPLAVVRGGVLALLEECAPGTR